MTKDNLSDTSLNNQQIIAVVPAAGVGKRMLANCPKQYLTIYNDTILAHTVNRLLNHHQIKKVIICLSKNDEYFTETGLASHPDVLIAEGGKERVDSVLNGLKLVNSDNHPWVLVHDAARPCVTHHDIDALIAECITHNCGGLLAAPVRDTMKRSDHHQFVQHTVERSHLWHALTPQMYKTEELKVAIEQALLSEHKITDESSAIELAGLPSLLVSASSENIKITHPDDLAFAEFILAKQQKQSVKNTHHN